LPTTSTTSTTEAPVTAGSLVPEDALKVGDCFDKRRVDGPEKSKVEALLVLPCDLPHQNEVFAVLKYASAVPAEGTTIHGAATTPTTVRFPGQPVFTEFAVKECPKRFKDYVGQSYELSAFELTYALPTESDWAAARHSIGCALADGHGRRLIGKQQGTGK
jgi:hypothetical protein